MNNLTNYQFHEDRDVLIQEAHARPYQPIEGAGQLLHIAFKAEPDVISNIGKIANENANILVEKYIFSMIEDVKISIEHHTEFTTITLMQFDPKNRASGDRAAYLHRFFKDKFPLSNMKILVLLNLNIFNSLSRMMKCLPKDQFICGGALLGAIHLRSTYRVGEDGSIDFYLHAKNQTSDELGRRVKRLLDMETYRSMTLLGLPLARKIGEQLYDFEKSLEQISASMRDTHNDHMASDKLLFDKLMLLSEQNNALASNTRYRFSASKAYYELFTQRIDSLDEVKDGELQTLTGFLKSRVDPAIATIDSTAKRQSVLTNDIIRALSLLRTRIELQLQQDNKKLMESMENKHIQHLKIARTVEGLSVVAISYYSVGLVSYLTKAIEKQPWWPLSNISLTAMSVPLIVFLTWLFLQRLRKHWD